MSISEWWLLTGPNFPIPAESSHSFVPFILKIMNGSFSLIMLTDCVWQYVKHLHRFLHLRNVFMKFHNLFHYVISLSIFCMISISFAMQLLTIILYNG